MNRKSLVAGLVVLSSLALPGAASAQVVNNAVKRTQLNAWLGEGQWRAQGWVWVEAGQRIVAKMAGGSWDADLWLYRWQDGANVSVSVSSGGWCDESIVYDAPASDWYQVSIYGYSGSGNFISTTDITWDKTSRLDTCFGASGPNCSGDVAANGCYHYYDGTVSCYTTIGSQKHDTCCSAHSANAIHCGGNESETWNCQGEWDRAVDDRFYWKLWSLDYNPTVVAYANSSLLNKQAYVSEWTWGWANNATLKVPNGVKIHVGDAERGFCASGCYDKPWWSGVDAWCKAC